MRPDLLQFNKDVQSSAFQAGVDAGHWGIQDANPECPTWPCVYIWVSSSLLSESPVKYFLKFDLSGYPATAPTACPWDIDRNVMLPIDRRPKGPQAVNSVFLSGFKDSRCLYTPLDREAQYQHDNWKTQYPELWWRPEFTIYTYVNYVFNLLN